jgi:hypothetical protein
MAKRWRFLRFSINIWAGGDAIFVTRRLNSGWGAFFRMSQKKYSGLDLLVGVVYGVGFLMVIANILWFDLEAELEFREQPALLHYVNAARPLFVTFAVASVLTWMIHGGVDSRLWRWLPPFCFFFWCNNWQKWVVVSIIIGGALLSMILAGIEAL